MSDGSGPRAVVAGHAGFAEALIGVVDRIAGRATAFVSVSNEGRDLRGVEAAIREALSAHGATIVFTDLPAGSVTMAARRVAQADPRVTIVTGANVAMLLEFAFGPDAGPAALERAAGRGRESIAVHPPGGPGAA